MGDRQTDRPLVLHGGQTDRQTDRPLVLHEGWGTGTQTDRRTDGLTDRQAIRAGSRWSLTPVQLPSSFTAPTQPAAALICLLSGLRASDLVDRQQKTLKRHQTANKHCFPWPEESLVKDCVLTCGIYSLGLWLLPLGTNQAES